MSQHHEHLGLDALRIAADDLDHKLNMPRREQHPVAGPSKRPRWAHQAHVESAEEADQIFRDEALARQIQDQYNDSLQVNQSSSRSSMRDRPPPRYSQVVQHPPELPRWTRDDEMLGRQIQDQYQSSLLVEEPDSRERVPPRYSQVIGTSRRDEGPIRQMQEQYGSSLNVNVSRSRADPRSSTSRRSARPQDHVEWKHEEVPRRLHEEFDSSLAVNQPPSTSKRPRRGGLFDDSPPPSSFEHGEHGEHGKSMTFDYSPHHKATQRTDKHRPESYYHHPIHRGSVPLVDEHVNGPWEGPETKPKVKDAKKSKKPQIRAKDHEHALRWLAGRRSLGGR